MLRFVAVRLVVWGGVALLVALLFSDLSRLVAPRPLGRPLGGEPETGRDRRTPAGRIAAGRTTTAISDETGLADAWPPEGPPVLWTREIGRGYSGFTAVGDRVFTQTQTPTPQ